MNKRDEKVEQYIAVSKKMRLGLSDELITKVTIELGPSIYKRGTETVFCCSSELMTIKKNFLQQKLELKESDDELDSALIRVCILMGFSNRNKYRALFYALLTKEFIKESVYLSHR